MENNIHKDHRKRVRQKFERVGLNGFAEHEILELVLFYAIPLRDTNPLAHRLIKEFGSLEGVFSASKDELLQVDGVSDHTATLLLLIPALLKDLSARTAKQTKRLNGFSDSINFASKLLAEEQREVVYIICLDRKNQVKATKEISSGSATRAVVDTKMLAKFVLQKNCDRIILAHNHPIGDAKPSDHDIVFTKQVIEQLSPLEIEVLDHIIISKIDSFSFAHEGVIDLIKQSLPAKKMSTIHQVADKKPQFSSNKKSVTK